MMREIISEHNDDKVIYNHMVYKNPTVGNCDLHTHDVCEIIFLRGGEVSAVIGGNVYKLHKNSLVIFKPHILHAIRIDGDADYDRFDILFDEKILAQGIYEKIPPYLDVVNYSGNNFVTDIFKKIDYYSKCFDRDNFTTLFYSLIRELVCNLSLVAEAEKNETPVSVNELVNKAIDFVDMNYAKHITVEDMSDALFVSKRHLHFLFNEQLNITPKKYINSIRLLKAQNLIRMGTNPSHAYSMCGFSNYSTFYRNYTEYFGHTPSEETNSLPVRKIKS